jgi:hypothetical protein
MIMDILQYLTEFWQPLIEAVLSGLSIGLATRTSPAVQFGTRGPCQEVSTA